MARTGYGSNTDEVVSKIIEQGTTRLKTGFKEFDDKTGGLERTNLLTVAAPSGGGKTAMSLYMATKMYELFHYNVCFISYEMNKYEVYSRILANISNVDHDRINLRKMSPVQKMRVMESWNKFDAIGQENKCKFEIWCPSEEYTASQLSRMLKPLKFDVIVVDYLNLIAEEKTSEKMWESLGRTTRKFKNMAVNLDCVVIMLTQLDRDTLQVKYSKAIEANSNFLWIWEYGDREEETKVIEIKQQKARNARKYPFKLKADFDYMRFENYTGLPDEEPKDTRTFTPSEEIMRRNFDIEDDL